MKCKVCGKDVKEIFKAKILNKYTISYFHCYNCGFLQTEEPYWLEEAYQTPITITDTGYIQRNIYLSKILTILLTVFFNPKGKFLDSAGGYGVLVRLMRDIGFDFYWDDKYTENLFARSFEWDFLKKGKVEAITSFESFEHFDNPVKEIENMLSISKNIIFTTELLPNTIPKPDEWWYYTVEDGQHISFYSEKTFMYIANYFGLRYAHLGNLHLLTEKKNISNLKLLILKLHKLGLYKILQRKIKSKTWEDYLLMRELLLKR